MSGGARAGLAGWLFLAAAAGAAAPDDRPEDAPRAAGAITNSLGMRLVKVPAGEFVMGNSESPDDLAVAFPAYELPRIWDPTDDPPHRVRITRPFLLGAHEVTVGQFRRFVAEAPYTPESERDGTGAWGYDPEKHEIVGRDRRYSWRDPGFAQNDDHPVVNVTWNDAVTFCHWLGGRERETYRLPTEAEWEYACRAGTTTRYNFGDDPEGLTRAAAVYDARTRAIFPEWGQYALDSSDGYAFTAPVGRFRPNAWGLYDMHGNVWEWCSDWFAADTYRNSPVADPKGPATGRARSRRGGAWHTWALYLRPCYRNFNRPDSRYPNLGFRVVREVDR